MKIRIKHIISLTIFMFLAQGLFSQMFVEERFGFFGGLSISNFTGDNLLGERDARSGLNIGAYYRHPLNRNENLALMPELMFVNKGGIFYAPQFNYTEIILQYLELPMLFLLENRRHMSFHIGPYISLLVNAEQIYYRYGDISTKHFSTFDFGGTAGFRARVNRYFLGLDISGGLVEIGKTKYYDGENHDIIGTSRNLVLMIYTGVFF